MSPTGLMYCMPHIIRRRKFFQDNLSISVLMEPNLPNKQTWSCSPFLKLLQVYWLDWTCFGVLIVSGALIWLFQPTFERRISQDQMVHFSYPVLPNTVSAIYLPVLSLAFPILVILFFFFWEKNIEQLHHECLGLFFAVILTWLVTNVLKNAVGRPRPNFGLQCFPNGVFKYDLNGNVACSVPRSDISSSCQSFPSGHASYTFAGMSYLCFVLSRKTLLFSHPARPFKLVFVLLPLAIATFVAVSRVTDYKHHWEDVVAGSLLGVVFAVLSFMQFHPPPLFSSEVSNSSHELSKNFVSQRSLETGDSVQVSESLVETNLYGNHFARLKRNSSSQHEVKVEEIIPITDNHSPITDNGIPLLPLETHPDAGFDHPAYPTAKTMPPHRDIQDTARINFILKSASC